MTLPSGNITFLCSDIEESSSPCGTSVSVHFEEFAWAAAPAQNAQRLIPSVPYWSGGV